VETAMLKIKKNQILEEAVAESGPGSGTGVKGTSREDLEDIHQ
jgi:hypothetical protein